MKYQRHKYNGKSNNNSAISSTNVEPDIGNEPVGEKEAPGFDSLVNIRVISYRKYKHDPDGISVKAVLDGLVRKGILADDSTEQIKCIAFESIKSKQEKTVIEITIV